MVSTQVILDKVSAMLQMDYIVLEADSDKPLYTTIEAKQYKKIIPILRESKLSEENKIYVARIDLTYVITFEVDNFEHKDNVTILFYSELKSQDNTYRLDGHSLASFINLIVLLLTDNDVEFSIEQFFYDIENKQLLSPMEFIDKSLSSEFLENRLNKQYHQSYFEEKKFFEAIKDGMPEAILKAKGLDGINEAKLANSEIRHKKNMLISVIALSTRMAIEGGLANEEAYLLSDKYIQLVEDMLAIKDLNMILVEIMVDFAKRVQMANRRQVSRTVFDCQEYVTTHIYEKITVASIAQNLHMNPNYLSTKFKKETGMSLSSYIQKQKIEEAKRMILYTRYDFSEIYSLLHFSDQSHFIKIFKKFTGVLPSEYKEANIF